MASLLSLGTFPIVFLVVATVIEALIMFQFRWAKLPGSFRDAAVANLVSAVVTVLVWQLISRIESPFLAIAAACAVAVIVEGFVLMLLRKRAAPACYLVALSMNVTSYIFALLYVLTFFLS